MTYFKDFKFIIINLTTISGICVQTFSETGYIFILAIIFIINEYSENKDHVNNILIK